MEPEAREGVPWGGSIVLLMVGRIWEFLSWLGILQHTRSAAEKKNKRHFNTEGTCR